MCLVVVTGPEYTEGAGQERHVNITGVRRANGFAGAVELKMWETTERTVSIISERTVCIISGGR